MFDADEAHAFVCDPCVNSDGIAKKLGGVSARTMRAGRTSTASCRMRHELASNCLKYA